MDKIKDKKGFIINLLVSIVYFLFLYTYYDVEYYVPDYRLYAYFSINNFMSKDGFSSLFLFLSGLTTIMPTFMNKLCLILISISIFNVLTFYTKMTNNKINIIYIVAILSVGIWYYVYGKIFYEFPFTMFTYSIGLIYLYKSIKEKENKNWYIFILLMGLTLSWKPYNIFIITGLFLLILSYKRTRILFISKVHVIHYSLIFFIIGYIIGNYNLMFYSKLTIEGILAYPAQYNFIEFLLTKNRIIWDHVNDMPFNISIYNLVSLFMITLVIPLLIKKYAYALSSIVIFICLYIYIEKFSPGYAWHGIPIGIYIVTLITFIMFSNKENKLINKIFKIAITIQVIVLIGYYITKQNEFHKETINAINIYKTEENNIYNSIEKIIEKNIKEESFVIEQPIKRYKPILKGKNNIVYFRTKGKYIYNTNIEYIDPLQDSNYIRYVNIISKKNYNVKKSKYIIYLIPNNIVKLKEIFTIKNYSEYSLIKEIYGNGYTIQLYKYIL